VQTVNSTSASNVRFIEMIAAQTLQAESSGSLLAKKREIDFVLRMAGTTQITRAIKNQGVQAHAPFIVVIASRSPVKGVRHFKGTELPKKELTVAELSRVEKAALLNAKRA